MNKDVEWLTLTDIMVGCIESAGNPYTIARSHSTWFVLGGGGFGTLEKCCNKPDPLPQHETFTCWSCLRQPRFGEDGSRWTNITPAIIETLLAKSENLDPLTASIRASELMSDFTQWLELEGHRREALNLGQTS